MWRHFPAGSGALADIALDSTVMCTWAVNTSVLPPVATLPDDFDDSRPEPFSASARVNCIIIVVRPLAKPLIWRVKAGLSTARIPESGGLQIVPSKPLLRGPINSSRVEDGRLDRSLISRDGGLSG